MSLYTIFGGNGFIGSYIFNKLHSQNKRVNIPLRDDPNIFKRNLGIVIYCAGNGDCKNQPFSVFESNTQLLSNILLKATFDKLIYISSTRVYMNQLDSDENANLTVCNEDSRRLFNLTKLVSEELCLRSNLDVTILRLSNVYGLAINSPLFLPSIIKDAINNKKINMYVVPSYEKDYISVDDVADICSHVINKNSKGKIINVASGKNVSADQIARIIYKNTQCKINWHTSNNSIEKFPIIKIDTLVNMFPNYKPRDILNDLEIMINDYKVTLIKKT